MEEGEGRWGLKIFLNPNELLMGAYHENFVKIRLLA